MAELRFLALGPTDCKILKKRTKKIPVRLFDDEIDLADALCFYYNRSYEQLFVKLMREHAEKLFS